MSEKQYIRVIKDGFIYDYNARMAVLPSCEVISEVQAFPERFVPEHAVKRVRKPVAKVQEEDVAPSGLNLTTDIPEEPVYTDPELAAEAGRNWPE
jgi:hypothetical protein